MVEEDQVDKIVEVFLIFEIGMCLVVFILFLEIRALVLIGKVVLGGLPVILMLFIRTVIILL